MWQIMIVDIDINPIRNTLAIASASLSLNLAFLNLKKIAKVDKAHAKWN